jgi:hypothetical protein
VGCDVLTAVLLLLLLQTQAWNVMLRYWVSGS